MNRFYLFAQNWSNENFLGKIWLGMAWILALKDLHSCLNQKKSDQPILKKVVNRLTELILYELRDAHRYKKVVGLLNAMEKVTSLTS